MIARRKKVEDDTELGEELRKNRAEAQVKLEGISEDYMLCVWRLGTVEHTAYSRWMAKSGLEKFFEEDLFFKNGMAVDVLEGTMRYGVESE